MLVDATASASPWMRSLTPLSLGAEACAGVSLRGFEVLAVAAPTDGRRDLRMKFRLAICIICRFCGMLVNLRQYVSMIR